ncbi:MAG: YbaB/EbfC family nucleoid-associated protein [Chloroflexota bacterium]|nr:YbaB/EbfC family nucleoid-associated protein [Chloroflexota bacterium]
MNPANAQNAFQALQQKMLEAQDALANENIEVSSGGGAVTVIVNGQQKIQSVKISADAIAAGDAEMLQDMIVAAMNEAIGRSQELASQKMGALTGGLGLPGLLG